MKPNNDFIENLCNIINKISEDQSEAINNNYSEYSLSVNEMRIIEIIGVSKKPKMMKDIAKLMSITKGGMTFLIDKLEKKELVERVQDTEDKRVSYIQFTKKGEKLFKNYNMHKYKCIYKMFKNMDKDSRENLQYELERAIAE